MTLAEAKTEFENRFSRWAITESEREADESFLHLAQIKDGPAWNTYQFLRTLTRKEVPQFIRLSCGRRPHSDVDKAMLARYFSSRCVQSPLELEIMARNRLGEKIKFVSKKNLQKTMTARFDEAFGASCFSKHVEVTGDLGSHFEMRVNDWNVSTAFWFGRKQSVISYRHNTTSEDTVAHPDDPRIYGPALALARGLCWTGLTTMEWRYLRAEDVEPACASVVDLCGRFFKVLPDLLDGLDRRNISDVSERDGRG